MAGFHCEKGCATQKREARKTQRNPRESQRLISEWMGPLMRSNGSHRPDHRAQQLNPVPKTLTGSSTKLLRCLAGIPHTMTHHLQHTFAVERLLLEHLLRLHPILRREKNGCSMTVSHRAGGNDLSGFHQSPHIVEMLRRESPTIRRILTEFRKDQHSLRTSHARRRPPSLGKSNRTDQKEQQCPHGSMIAPRQCRRARNEEALDATYCASKRG